MTPARPSRVAGHADRPSAGRVPYTCCSNVSDVSNVRYVAADRHVTDVFLLCDLVTVDHRDPTPLYVQLAAVIRAMITTGQLATDDLVPSESYLQQTHGVSRVTVRKAIEVLRNEGLVYTLPPRGTYVR
jgi:hypothetical protein